MDNEEHIGESGIHCDGCRQLRDVVANEDILVHVPDGSVVTDVYVVVKMVDPTDGSVALATGYTDSLRRDWINRQGMLEAAREDETFCHARYDLGEDD